QTRLDEAAVARLDEARREDHEARRARRDLGREQDARLLATAQRVWVRSHELAEERVETAGRDAPLPVLEGVLERRHKLLRVPARLCREVHARRPLDLDEVLLDL